MIIHSKPWLTESDLSYLKRVLGSHMLAQGKETDAFEKALSRRYGIDDGGVAVGSGAAAVLPALVALEIRPGDEVVLPTYVCHTVLEAVLTLGATPVCCDVGPQIGGDAGEHGPLSHQPDQSPDRPPYVWHFCSGGLIWRLGHPGDLGRPDDAFPVAVRHFQETVSLPLYPALTGVEHTRCLEAAVEIFSQLQQTNRGQRQRGDTLQSHSRRYETN